MNLNKKPDKYIAAMIPFFVYNLNYKLDVYLELLLVLDFKIKASVKNQGNAASSIFLMNCTNHFTVAR
jgi:hypothetical protein